MQLIRESKILISTLTGLKDKDPDMTVGFVPTMGALHEGHLSLIRACKAQCDLVVCSIFVNPTQFNDPADLEKYPRKESEDLALLEREGCDYVYLPSVKDIYPSGSEDYEIELGILNEVMEGKFRPDHFRGVAMVVERFFEIVKPDYAFFGEKDFQQLAVIRHMARLRDLSVRIIAVETARSEDGLALSSRNLLLNKEQLQAALIIYETMVLAQAFKEENNHPADVISDLLKFFEKGNLRLEYLEIVDQDTLLPAEQWQNARICIAAYSGKIRLIDNMGL